MAILHVVGPVSDSFLSVVSLFKDEPHCDYR